MSDISEAAEYYREGYEQGWHDYLEACAAGPWHDVDDPPKDTGEETEYLTECICDDWNPATQEVEPHREITMDIGYDFKAGRWDVDSGVEILRWAEIREPKGEGDE